MDLLRRTVFDYICQDIESAEEKDEEILYFENTY